MPEPIVRLQITPFDSSVADLDRDEQLVLLKGCVLCQITRDVDNESTRNKPEWKSCKAELGVPIEVFTMDRVDARLLSAMDGGPPAVFGITESDGVVLLLDRDALERCRGSVTDFRGRLAYRLAVLDLELTGS